MLKLILFNSDVSCWNNEYFIRGLFIKLHVLQILGERFQTFPVSVNPLVEHGSVPTSFKPGHCSSYCQCEIVEFRSLSFKLEKAAKSIPNRSGCTSLSNYRKPIIMGVSWGQRLVMLARWKISSFNSPYPAASSGWHVSSHAVWPEINTI